MELTDGLLLIAASGVGAVCGILGQSIREWLSRPRLNIMASADEQSSALILYFINLGRKSTEDLAIDIVHYDDSMRIGSEKVILHTTDLTIHPKTAQTFLFGRFEDRALRIKRSDFGKALKYSDDSAEGQEEWVFPLPAKFYVSACAKDTKARVKAMTAGADGIRLENPRAINYGTLKKQSALYEKD